MAQIKTNVPEHNQTNKMICTSSQDSDKPGHPPSLIRVFSVHMRNPGVLGYRLSALQKLIGPARYPGLSSLHRMLRSFCWLCHARAHILCVICNNCGDNIWAATWQNQQSGCAPSKDSDQLGHPPSLIRVFACTQWVAKDPSFLHADIRPRWSESSLGAQSFC